MGKLALEMDKLVVESFDAGGVPELRGTVRGQSIDNFPTNPTDAPYATCDLECATFAIQGCPHAGNFTDDHTCACAPETQPGAYTCAVPWPQSTTALDVCSFTG